MYVVLQASEGSLTFAVYTSAADQQTCCTANSQQIERVESGST